MDAAPTGKVLHERPETKFTNKNKIVSPVILEEMKNLKKENKLSTNSLIVRFERNFVNSAFRAPSKGARVQLLSENKVLSSYLRFYFGLGKVAIVTGDDVHAFWGVHGQPAQYVDDFNAAEIVDLAGHDSPVLFVFTTKRLSQKEMADVLDYSFKGDVFRKHVQRERLYRNIILVATATTMEGVRGRIQKTPNCVGKAARTALENMLPGAIVNFEVIHYKLSPDRFTLQALGDNLAVFDSEDKLLLGLRAPPGQFTVYVNASDRIDAILVQPPDLAVLTGQKQVKLVNAGGPILDTWICVRFQNDADVRKELEDSDYLVVKVQWISGAMRESTEEPK